MHTRIIPARAGFTPWSVSLCSSQSDHPRSRGVYFSCLFGCVWSRGSSPLARGLHPGPRSHVAPHRIIPARAGFTLSLVGVCACVRDHPRSRGVYDADATANGLSYGSSPLARGLHHKAFVRAVQAGIIPARAGFTAGREELLDANRDHPRSRGVYGTGRTVSMPVCGSSPLARGLRPGVG